MIRLFQNNWKYKLLALMVSLILWAHVNAERNPHSTKTFDVTLKPVNLAKSHVAELNTPKVSVTVAGLKTSVDALTKEDVEAWVDISKLRMKPDVTKASLAVERRLPRALEGNLDVTISPAKVAVRVEALRERRMPVEVAFTSDPPQGYSYGTPVLTPDYVAVRGTAGALSRVKHVLLTLEGDTAGSAAEDYYDVFPLDSSGNPVPGVALRPGRVKAKLDMVEVPATKTVLVSPAIEGAPKFPLRVSRYTVTPSFVTLRGKPSKLSAISVIPTSRISIDGADATVTHEAELRIPSGVKASGARNVRVTVFITSE